MIFRLVSGLALLSGRVGSREKSWMPDEMGHLRTYPWSGQAAIETDSKAMVLFARHSGAALREFGGVNATHPARKSF